MENPTQAFILDIMNQARDLTLATLRSDGYPQATTVSFAHDGLTIYIGVGKDSQKARNIGHSNKVSLTINTDYQDWSQIKGLSMAALAEILTDPREVEQASNCLLKRFPQAAEWAEPGARDQIVLLKIKPQVVSVLNYEKGFGHTDLVTV